MGFCVRDSISALRDLHFRLVGYLYNRKRKRCFPRDGAFCAKGIQVFRLRGKLKLFTESGICENFACGIQNTAQRIQYPLSIGIQNPSSTDKDWNPAAGVHYRRLSSISLHGANKIQKKIIAVSL